MDLHLTFGALSAPIEEQLREQRLCVADKHVEHLRLLQMDADALVRLCIRDVLPDSAAQAARRKLIKRVAGLQMMRISGRPREFVSG